MVSPEGTSSVALRQRVLHFVSEVETHLVGEIELLASWAGARPRVGGPAGD